MADKPTWQTFPWNSFSPSDIVSYENLKFIRFFTNHSTSLYPEPLECSPLSHTFVFMIHFNIFFPYTPASPSKFLSNFAINIVYEFLVSPCVLRVLSNPPWFEHAKITLKQLKNVVLWYIFQKTSVHSFYMFLQIFILRIKIWNTVSLPTSFNGRDQFTYSR